MFACGYPVDNSDVGVDVIRTVPVKMVGSGRCYICQSALGHYDSKWIEQIEPYRLVCYDCGWSKECHGIPSDAHKTWFWYTDG